MAETVSKSGQPEKELGKPQSDRAGAHEKVSAKPDRAGVHEKVSAKPVQKGLSLEQKCKSLIAQLGNLRVDREGDSLAWSQEFGGENFLFKPMTDLHELIDRDDGWIGLQLLENHIKDSVVGQQCLYVLSEYALSRPDSAKGVRAAVVLGDGLKDKQTRGACAHYLSALAKESPTGLRVSSEAFEMLNDGVKYLEAGLAEPANRRRCIETISAIEDEFSQNERWDSRRAGANDFSKMYMENLDQFREGMLHGDEYDCRACVEALMRMAYRYYPKSESGDVVRTLWTGLETEDRRDEVLDVMSSFIKRSKKPPVEYTLGTFLDARDDYIREVNRIE